jgi:hypothetical protein
LNAFTTGVPLGDELGDLLGRRATSRRCQPVPRLGVDRIRDVDDDLASEPIGVLLDGLLDAGVVDGEDDYLAAERSRGVDDARGVAKLVGERPRLGRVAVEDFYVVAARDGARADAAPHVAGADDRDLHGVSSTSLSVRERLAIVLAGPSLLGEHCRPVI